jgi:hypothetical protein
MDDELLGARVGAALRELYPEVLTVPLNADQRRGPSGHRIVAAVVAVAAVVVLAVGLSVFAASRGSGPTSPTSGLRIENHRLAAPFSLNAGAVQLTRPAAGDPPAIPYHRARQLIFAGAAARGHAVFLATLSVYPGGHGPPSPAHEQVWLSAVRGVPQSALGPSKNGDSINHDYVDIIAIDAHTGRDVQQILIGKPDPHASSAAPR